MPKDKSEKKGKKRKEPKEERTTNLDVEMVDVETVAFFISIGFYLQPMTLKDLTQEIKERERRNYHSPGGFITLSPAPRPEKACQETTQDDQKRYQTSIVSRAKPETCVASKARQVKRGVKEVVKGIRKGEKGYVTSS